MNLKKLLIMEFLALVLRVCNSADILSKFHQSGYKLRNLMVDVPYENKELMHSFHAIGYKHNRTVTALNITFSPKLDVEDKIEIVFQAYKRASNEYRIFPIRFQLNLCKTIASNAVGLKNIVQYGNITRCFWKKDTIYSMHGFTLDETHMPPYIPAGEFKDNINAMHLERKLFTFNVHIC